ncbi:hypothetical protein [Bordetella petrii]|uniref:hypothetical protein n=1 Tax=Bordetella petrii TaxID=94624 RepID=UPI001A96C92F|nr:hypothetical protein [Bordetella petrii]MBO1113519.1 hypothetical protein [Bordetella petrii]
MRTPSVSVLLPLLAGPLAWAAHFVFIYAANGVFCARPHLHGLWVDGGLAAATLIGAALLAVAAIALVYWRQWRRWPAAGDAGFLRWVAGALSLLAGLAIVWQTLPVLLVPACSGT